MLEGLNASQLIVAAEAENGPALFLVEGGAKGLERQAEPAMGLKACSTARVLLKGVKVPTENRLAAADFDYPRFLDFTTLAWCALALGTGQAALTTSSPTATGASPSASPSATARVSPSWSRTSPSSWMPCA